MNGTHKGHNIIVSVARRPTTRQWEPRLTVIWSEEGQGKLNKLTVDRAFRARQEAEMKDSDSPKNGSMTENQICQS
jgi:hypothetical protein